MSFKSMESVLNLFNNNKPLRKQYSKESVIYSTELVNDMRKISKYDAFSKEFDDNLARISDEIDMISYSVENYFNNIDKRVSIATSLKEKYSVEMMNFYIDAFASRSTETIGEKAKAAGSAVVNTIKEAVKRIIAFFYGLIKKLEAFVKRLFIGSFAKTEKEFKAENFTNMDAEVSVHKLASNLNASNFGFSDANSNKLDASVYNKGGASMADKNAYEDEVAKKIYQKYFGTDEKPKAEKMTVATFLNAKSGQRPALIDLISDKGVENVKKGQKVFENNIKIAKDLEKHIVSLNKKKDDDYGKETTENARNRLKLLNLMQKSASLEFTCIFTVLSDVNKAVKAGLKKAKEEKK